MALPGRTTISEFLICLTEWATPLAFARQLITCGLKQLEKILNGVDGPEGPSYGRFQTLSRVVAGFVRIRTSCRAPKSHDVGYELLHPQNTRMKLQDLRPWHPGLALTTGTARGYFAGRDSLLNSRLFFPA